jgi:hypothetical protein
VAACVCAKLGVVDAAEFAVEIGGPQVDVGEGPNGAGILVCPVEPGPGEELHAAVVDPRGHAKAVQFDLMAAIKVPTVASRPAGKAAEG